MPKRFDWLLLAAALLLTIIGLVVLYAINFRDPNLAGDFDPTKQLVSALLGLAALVLGARLDYRLWFRLAPAWYGLAIVLLIVVVLFGDSSGGARLAIDLGILQFQPAEVAKLGLIFMLARLYSARHGELKRLRWLAVSLLVLGLPAAIMIQQPEFGSALVLGLIWLGMTLGSGIRRSYLIILIIAVAGVAPLLYGQLEPYQQERIQTVLNPGADLQGAGYNVNQATIAVGSGQLLGRGLGGGTQSSLNFLPSQHTDFIFAVLAEKLGLLGAGVVIGLFGVLLWRGFLITWRARDRFGSLMALGLSVMFLIQALITIGMNLGIAPVAGLPLPFIAYGGTNLIVSLFAVGVLQSIATHTKELQFRS